MNTEYLRMIGKEMFICPQRPIYSKSTYRAGPSEMDLDLERGDLSGMTEIAHEFVTP